jgi:hypothetical protein
VVTSRLSDSVEKHVSDVAERPNRGYSPHAGKSYEVFLQGSYANDTNTYAESDVDTVIRLDAIFGYDLSALPLDQQAAFRQAFSTPASYTFSESKQGVATRLSDALGSQYVTFGTKTFKITASGSRRSADVLACYQYRYYTRFVNHNDCLYIPGITFPNVSGEWIINYPKQHSEHCTTKHQATNGWFKPMVRILKNMRSRMINDGIIADGRAPSYFMRGLLYNVPIDHFGGGYSTTFYNIVNCLLGADKTRLRSANEMYFLLGNSRLQWTTTDCNLFLNGLVTLWNNWR